MNSQQITQNSSFSILSSPRRNNGRIVNLFAEFGLNLVCDTFPQPVGKITRSSGRLRADALMFCSCSGFKPSSFRNSIEFLSPTKFIGCHYSLKGRNRMSMCSVRKTNENASLTAILLNSQSDLHPKFGCRTCGLTRFVSGLRFISLFLSLLFSRPHEGLIAGYMRANRLRFTLCRPQLNKLAAECEAKVLKHAAYLKAGKSCQWNILLS